MAAWEPVGGAYPCNYQSSPTDTHSQCHAKPPNTSTDIQKLYKNYTCVHRPMYIPATCPHSQTVICAHIRMPAYTKPMYMCAQIHRNVHAGPSRYSSTKRCRRHMHTCTQMHAPAIRVSVPARSSWHTQTKQAKCHKGTIHKGEGRVKGNQKHLGASQSREPCCQCWA